MDTVSILQAELLLQPCDVDVCLDRDPSGLSAKCLVPIQWLNRLSRTGKVTRPRHNLSEAERQAIVQYDAPRPSNAENLVVYICCVPKSARLVRGWTSPVPSRTTDDDDDSDPSVMSYLQRFCSAEGERVWKQYDRLRMVNRGSGTKIPEELTSGYISDLVRHVYCCTLLTLSTCDNGDNDGGDSDVDSNNTDGVPSPGLCHPNLLPIFCAVEGQKAFFFVHPFVTHTLKELVTFTPAVLRMSTVKQLFVTYQLLQALRELHNHNVAHGNLTISNVAVNEKLWVRLHLPRFFTTEENGKPFVAKSGSTPTAAADGSGDNGDLICYMKQWMSGEMSNFDYLMALNATAGRRLGNPNNHPVMPWIMDFSQLLGGWRDLTKSKFRLNKGDSQLDLTYEAGTILLGDLQAHQADMTSHHITDVLSDITYYVYLARRVPKEVLCAYVRPQWVPNEYPASIQRMQEWTPEECIPQFFTDPEVFRSIHPDLPDLEVPAWASSPEDFIAKHRSALESRHVSDCLHHWIDVTFGFKLSGSPSVEEKNVYLSLVDDHAKPTSRGIVQLFTRPHPKKSGFDRCLTSFLRVESRLAGSSPLGMRARSNSPPVDHVKANDGTVFSPLRQNSALAVTPADESDGCGIVVEYPAAKVVNRDDPDAVVVRKKSPLPEESTGDPSSSDQNRFQNLTLFGRQRSTAAGPQGKQMAPNLADLPIELPSDFDPLALMKEFEAIAKFNLSCLDYLEEGDGSDHLISSFEYHARRDFRYLACLIVDVLAYEKTSGVVSAMSLEQKMGHCRRMITAKEITVPHFIQKFLDVVIVLNRRKICALPVHLKSDILVSSFNGVLPFPSYFPTLYECLRVFICETDMHASGWTQNPVDVVTHWSRRLFHSLDAEGFDVLLPFLLPLFVNEATRFEATQRFFEEVSRRLGRRRTYAIFLKPLLALMENPPSPKAHAKLLYVGFIRQLIKGFGMEGFLERFSRFVIESVVASSPSYYETARSGNQNKRTSVDTGDLKDSLREETDGKDVFANDVTASPPKDGTGDGWVEIAADGDASPEANDVSVAEAMAVNETGEQPDLMSVASEGNDVSVGVDVSGVAMDTLRWLCQFVGPVLTSNYLVVPLLKGLCSTTLAENGDFPRSLPALKSLMQISFLYGKTIVLEQYVPFVEECVKTCELRLNSKTELSLVSSIALLCQCILQLPYNTLLNQIEGMCRLIFQRIIVLVSSPTRSFSAGPVVRLAAARLLVNTFVAVANCLGREEAQPVLAFPLQQFFSSFDRLYPTTAAMEPDSIERLRLRSLRERHKELGIEASIPSPTKRDATDGDDGETNSVGIANGEVMDQLKLVFTPAFAQSSYVQLCQLMGQINMRRLLYNADLIEQLAYGSLERQQGSQPPAASAIYLTKKGDEMASIDATYSNPLKAGSSDEDSDDGLEINEVHFGPSSWFVDLEERMDGGGIRLTMSDEQFLPQFEEARAEFNKKLTPTGTSSLDIRNQQPESGRSVEGTWLTHWKNLRGAHPRSPYRLERLKLQTYVGHVGAVRSLCAANSQQFFLSGGKDKTVKLWSLTSQGDGSAELTSQFTYTDHQRPLLGVHYIERTNSVLSCCSSLHIWDPNKGRKLRGLEAKSPILAVTCMPSPHAVVVAATDSNFQFADIRVGQFVHNWKMFPTSGFSGSTPRCLCVDSQGRYLIAGFSGGILSLFDARTGLSVKMWKVHVEDVTKIRETGDHNFVSTAQDGHMFIWDSSGGSLVTILRGHNEGVVDAQVYRDEVVTVSGSKLGIHTVYNFQSSFNAYRIKPDLVKGSLTSLELLPLSREFLVGTDGGQILHLA
eukprot:m.79677 g.79677  ORF g.79677 m.79677 type:complete len:1819 (+) comp36147_c0_seq2:63-5519(+)